MAQVVFIIGTGRSGSSILHEILGYHPRVAWMSSLCDSRPRSPHVNRRVLEAMRLPLIGRLLRRRYEPHESYRFFDVSYPGFSAPARDLNRSDLTARAATDLRNRLRELSPPDRSTLIVKLTGWPRIGFLDALVPGAKFIHLLRDGRAVANSLLQVPWWHGWKGPNNWRFGPLSREHEQLWFAHDRSFAALAAIEWRLILEALEESRTAISPDRMLDVRYEELCADDTATMQRVIRYLGLAWSPELDRALREFPLRTRNDKWRDDLGAHNASIVEDVLRDILPQYGYVADRTDSH